MKQYIVQISVFFLLIIVYTDTNVSTSERMKIHVYEAAFFQKMSNMTSEKRVYENPYSNRIHAIPRPI